MKRIVSLGPLVVDLVVSLQKLPAPGEMNYVTEEQHGKISKNVGGHAAIVSTNMVKLGWRPDCVSVVGAVGDDENGRFLEKSLGKHEMTLKLFKGESPTAENIIIAVQGEEKRYDLNPGANLDLNRDFSLKALDELQPDIVYCCPGYTGIDNNLKYIFGEIKEKFESFIFLDSVDPYERPKNFVASSLKYVNAFKLNQEEAKIVTGASTIPGSLERLRNLGVETVFITRGPEGVEGFSNETSFSQPSFKVKSVDQTGCGDAFSAGLIYQMEETGKPFSSMSEDKLIRTLAFGQATGAIAATEAGSTTAVSREKVSSLLDEQKAEVLSATEVEDQS